MATYDLGMLAHKVGQRRPRIVLPAIPSRNADREALRCIFVGVVDGGADERAGLLRLANAAQSALTTDDLGLDHGMRAFRGSQASRLGQASATIRGWVDKVAARFDGAWVRAVKVALAIDIGVLVQAADTQAVLALVAQKLTAQVKALSDEVANRIEAGLIDLITKGASVKAKAAVMAEQVAKARRSAERVARRETEVLHAVMNQFRQQQAGISEYTWWTRQDERVRGDPTGRYPRSRPSHHARHERVYRWDRPPSENATDGHPGHPPNCRCVARAFVSTEPARARSDPNRARIAGLRAVAGELGLSL